MITITTGKPFSLKCASRRKLNRSRPTRSWSPYQSAGPLGDWVHGVEQFILRVANRVDLIFMLAPEDFRPVQGFNQFLALSFLILLKSNCTNRDSKKS